MCNTRYRLTGTGCGDQRPVVTYVLTWQCNLIGHIVIFQSCPQFNRTFLNWSEFFKTRERWTTALYLHVNIRLLVKSTEKKNKTRTYDYESSNHFHYGFAFCSCQSCVLFSSWKVRDFYWHRIKNSIYNFNCLICMKIHMNSLNLHNS